MAKVEGRLTRKRGASTIRVEIEGKLSPPALWDEFFAQLMALGQRYNVYIGAPRKKKPAARKKPAAKKKAVKK